MGSSLVRRSRSWGQSARQTRFFYHMSQRTDHIHGAHMHINSDCRVIVLWPRSARSAALSQKIWRGSRVADFPAGFSRWRLTDTWIQICPNVSWLSASKPCSPRRFIDNLVTSPTCSCSISIRDPSMILPSRSIKTQLPCGIYIPRCRVGNVCADTACIYQHSFVSHQRAELFYNDEMLGSLAQHCLHASTDC